MRAAALRLLGGLAALGAMTLAGGCTVASTPSGQAQSTVQRHGLLVHLSARTSGPAGTVRVVVRAEDAHAPGALRYVVRFGDGAVAQNRVPLFCVPPPGPRRRATWHLTHRYARAGSYRLSVHVSANCAAAVATTSVRLHVG